MEPGSPLPEMPAHVIPATLRRFSGGFFIPSVPRFLPFLLLKDGCKGGGVFRGAGKVQEAFACGLANNLPFIKSVFCFLPVFLPPYGFCCDLPAPRNAAPVLTCQQLAPSGCLLCRWRAWASLALTMLTARLNSG